MSANDVRVVVCGAAGRMGRETVRAVVEAEGVTLVGAVDHHEVGHDAGDVAGAATAGVSIGPDLGSLLDRTPADVLVDFTLPSSVFANATAAIARRVSPVIGTTGMDPAALQELDRLAREAGVGALVAPNFAIGAVLMMRFAAEAAKYLPDVEIIELHHGGKLDSPSGTAMLTAERIAMSRAGAGAAPASAPAGVVEKAPGARGARGPATGDVPIHSVRLPGFVAHQEVIFGGVGQTLTLRHDSLDRRSFMPGVLLAVRRVRGLTGLVVGLEHLL